MTDAPATLPATIRVIHLQAAGGADQLVVEQMPLPDPGEGEALVRVHAAAITRDELDWPVERLPAIPSYELSGVVAAVAPGVDEGLVGEAVYALTRFDRDGVAADYALVLGAAARAQAAPARPHRGRRRAARRAQRVAGALRPRPASRRASAC